MCSTVRYSLYSSGGVELVVKDGKIKCTNTLESRLELLASQVKSLATQQLIVFVCLCPVYIPVDDA